MGCFTTLLVLAIFILVLVSMIRWFEQITEAVDNGWWNKVTFLMFVPFGVWMYESKVSASRPTPFARHEPVRGFGSMPKPVSPLPPQDQPPPGTPKEFLGMPTIPPPKPRAKSSVDPEKLAKLKQKMREQGMLPPEE